MRARHVAEVGKDNRRVATNAKKKILETGVAEAEGDCSVDGAVIRQRHLRHALGERYRLAISGLQQLQAPTNWLPAIRLPLDDGVLNLEGQLWEALGGYGIGLAPNARNRFRALNPTFQMIDLIDVTD